MTRQMDFDLDVIIPSQLSESVKLVLSTNVVKHSRQCPFKLPEAPTTETGVGMHPILIRKTPDLGDGDSRDEGGDSAF